jgi:hypothetical protein
MSGVLYCGDGLRRGYDFGCWSLHSSAAGRATSQESAQMSSPLRSADARPEFCGPLVFFRLAGITSLLGCSA